LKEKAELETVFVADDATASKPVHVHIEVRPGAVHSGHRADLHACRRLPARGPAHVARLPATAWWSVVSSGLRRS
jgi:hypothetical protein